MFCIIRIKNKNINGHETKQNENTNGKIDGHENGRKSIENAFYVKTKDSQYMKKYIYWKIGEHFFTSLEKINIKFKTKK